MGEATINLSQGNWVKIRIQFSSQFWLKLSNCQAVLTVDCWLTTADQELPIPRPNDHLKPDSPKLCSGPSCPTTSGGLSALCLPELAGSAWPQHESPTSPPGHVSGSKKMRSVVASGKTHQPSQSSHHRVSSLELNTNTGCESFVSQKPWKAP